MAAEFITTNRSKGEVLLFRKGHKSTTPSKAVSDEETGRSDRVYRNEKEVVSSSHHPATRQPTRQQHQAVFHWKDVCYDITIKGEDRRILSHVAGWVKPGTLTALMVRSIEHHAAEFMLTLPFRDLLVLARPLCWMFWPIESRWASFLETC